MSTYKLNGTYGSAETPCTVLCYESGNGTWYCVEDSVNVNFTFDELSDGVDVELVSDTDMFTASNQITALTELEEFIDNE